MEVSAQTAQWKAGARAETPRKAMAEPLNDDRELLRLLSKGNDRAFATVYARYQGPIYRFALHMSGNPAVAEEVAQEVFMALITKTSGYDPAKGSLAGYLFGIARNITRRSLEQVRFDLPIIEESLDDADTDPASELDVLEELSHSELLQCLRRAVLALPEQYREVVVLCDLEEMSYENAAVVLECSPGTVASRLHRAKNILRTRLKGQGCVR